MPQFTVDPLASPGEFDVMVAAGQQSVGVCSIVRGGSRKYNWDIKQAPGTQGYTLTYRGWKGGDPIVARFTFFEYPDGPGYVNGKPAMVHEFYTNWVPIWAIDARKAQRITPIPGLPQGVGASQVAVDVYHPILFANDITALVCEEIGPLQTDGKMSWWVEMTFLEFRPPRIIKPETPQGATAALGVPTPKGRAQILFEQQAVLAGLPGVGG